MAKQQSLLAPIQGLADFSFSSAHIDWIRKRPRDLEAF